MDHAMKSDDASKKRRRNPDRLIVNSDSITRLNGWKEQVIGSVKGIKLSLSELLNWLVLRQSAELSPAEVQEIAAQFFDEVKFAEWATRELKTRKARGEKVSLLSLISSEQGSYKRPGTRKKRIQGGPDVSPVPDQNGAISTGKTDSSPSEEIAKIQLKTRQNIGISVDQKTDV